MNWFKGCSYWFNGKTEHLSTVAIHSTSGRVYRCTNGAWYTILVGGSVDDAFDFAENYRREHGL